MSKQYRFGIVILHYMSMDITQKCIQSLQAYDAFPHLFIEIVDNASPDHSGQTLREMYAGCNNIHVTINRENMGFARGNNVGYRYVKEQIGPDFIIVANNDIAFTQEGFFEKIEEIYEKERFAVLGPDIRLPLTTGHANPMRSRSMTVEELNAKIAKYTNNIEHSRKNYFTFCVRNAWNAAKAGLKRKLHITANRNKTYQQKMVNPVLNGACYIFSRDFIDVRDMAFNPATFMYYEEDLLYLECMHLKLRLLYDPEIYVLHYEGISTGKISKNGRERYLIKNKRLLESVRILKDITAKYQTDTVNEDTKQS